VKRGLVGCAEDESSRTAGIPACIPQARFVTKGANIDAALINISRVSPGTV